MPVVDDYIADLDESARWTLGRVRDVAVAEAPGCEQGTSYGTPALRYRGRPLIGFLASKDHLSVFPFSTEAVDAVRDQLTGFKLSKGTVRFTADHPLPDDVVRTLVRTRMAEIDRG